MHDTTTHTSGTPAETAVMTAIAAVPTIVREHALNQVCDYIASADHAASDPNRNTEEVHREQAAKWACIARENGATEQQITTAYREGHRVAAPIGDNDGDD